MFVIVGTRFFVSDYYKKNMTIRNSPGQYIMFIRKKHTREAPWRMCFILIRLNLPFTIDRCCHNYMVNTATNILQLPHKYWIELIINVYRYSEIRQWQTIHQKNVRYILIKFIICFGIQNNFVSVYVLLPKCRVIETDVLTGYEW